MLLGGTGDVQEPEVDIIPRLTSCWVKAFRWIGMHQHENPGCVKGIFLAPNIPHWGLCAERSKLCPDMTPKVLESRLVAKYDADGATQVPFRECIEEA